MPIKIVHLFQVLLVLYHPFEDPKEFDDTSKTKKYKECSLIIASEIFYVFNGVHKSLNPYK